MTVWGSNLAAYSAQLAVLAAAALIASWALRIRSPRPALFFWNAVLLGSVCLPATSVWRTVDEAPSSVLVRLVGTGAAAVAWEPTPLAAGVLVVVLAGAALRLAWIGLGLVRLGLIRRRSRPLSPLPDVLACLPDRLGARASIHVSDEVACPVTIGFLNPLVLLPRRAVELPPDLQRTIVCHELLHVRRRDWLHGLVEQIWSALLWFHPAAYLLLSRIGLMREAVVDQETLRVIGDRRLYAQALLAFADSSTADTPLPVMHLIRPRHLSRRIAFIAQEAHMSRRHSIAAVAAALLVASIAAHAASARLPLTSASIVGARRAAGLDRQAPYKPGDAVSMPRAIKEVKPRYTAAGLQRRIQGSVWIDLVVLPSGEPSDITVTDSLDVESGLDDAAVQAVSEWRFEPGRKDGKPVPVTITIQITFTLK